MSTYTHSLRHGWVHTNTVSETVWVHAHRDQAQHPRRKINGAVSVRYKHSGLPVVCTDAPVSASALDGNAHHRGTNDKYAEQPQRHACLLGCTRTGRGTAGRGRVGREALGARTQRRRRQRVLEVLESTLGSGVRLAEAHVLVQLKVLAASHARALVVAELAAVILADNVPAPHNRQQTATT